MQRIKKVSIFLGIGFFIAGTAVFADKIGWTLGTSWSKARVAILVLGLLVALIPWSPWKRSTSQVDKPAPNDLFTFPALLIVMAAYFVFMSISHESTSGYYSLLATSFRQGELSLSLRPDPALLALADPYDPAARQGIKAPLDLSLYKGKFYLYWGPAPALLVALAKPLLPGQVTDGCLLLAFLCGIFLLEFLLIMQGWERFFSGIPKWIVVLSILVAGLINPTLWLLSRPKIYETAIAGGQFFFMAGLLSAVAALDRPAPSGWRLALAGLFWLLAVGTRSVLVFSIAFMVLMVIIWFYKLYGRSLRRLVTGLIPLGVPLLIGAIAFCWYNWARFGSLSETGFRYALAGPHLQKHLNELFLPAYVLQNLYNYLLNPFTLHASFPFLYPLRGSFQGILPWQVLPEIYSAQAITGILWSAPFVLFAAIPTFLALKQVSKRSQTNNASEPPQKDFLHWIITSLIGSSLLAFLCLLAFFWVAMRYAEDFMPTVALLGVIGFWQAYRSLSEDAKQRTIVACLGTALASISILIGTLLALSNYFTNGTL